MGYTANLFLPFALLAAMTFLPFFVFILVLKPCVLFLGVLCGWYVLFIYGSFILFHSICCVYSLDAILPEYDLRYSKFLRRIPLS